MAVFLERPLGPSTSLTFENYDSIWFQVHEMVLIEKGGPEQFADEISAYADLVPRGSNLVGTFMIEIDSPERRRRMLRDLGEAGCSYLFPSLLCSFSVLSRLIADKIQGVESHMYSFLFLFFELISVFHSNLRFCLSFLELQVLLKIRYLSYMKVPSLLLHTRYKLVLWENPGLMSRLGKHLRFTSCLSTLIPNKKRHLCSFFVVDHVHFHHSCL